MKMPNTKPRDMIAVRVDADLARLVRLHRVETGESVNSLVTRLLRAQFEPKPRKSKSRRPRSTQPAA